MYVDAFFDKDKDVVLVVERNADGERIYKTYPVDHHFFISDIKGTHRNIYGDIVKKISPKSSKEKQLIIKRTDTSKLWESDISPVIRCLSTQYDKCENPKLQVAFFDIETGFDQDFGYSSPTDALNKIISIAVNLQWLDRTVCLAIAPPTLSAKEAQDIVDDVGDTILCESEEKMLSLFLSIIQDADVLSGWNSDLFDVIYLVNRITKVLSENDTTNLCLFGKKPHKREVEINDKKTFVYDLVGRIHLDYMQLYKQYNYEERQSYALDNIANIELGDSKVPYEGTLDSLYRNDFKLFLRYNIQDAELLNRLDKKLQFIDLINTVAHENSVRIQQASGSVVTTENAIVKMAHDLGLVVPNKKNSGSKKAAGGRTDCQQKGLFEWVGSADLNSLYPSVIRALNASPETIVGQLRTFKTDAHLEEYMSSSKKHDFASFWNGKFCTEEMQVVHDDNTYDKIILDMEDGTSYEVTGAEVRSLVFDSGKPWCISANGTIFRYDKEGIVPIVLKSWYTERKLMQAINKSYDIIADGYLVGDIDVRQDETVEKADAYSISDAFRISVLEGLVSDGNLEKLNQYCNMHSLIKDGDKIVPKDVSLCKEYSKFWHKRQLVKKILLNSVYGGLLNEHHRFYDQRIGQSTTLTGRSITRHMSAKTNEFLTGEYNHMGETILYTDTDSVYFSAYPVLKDKIKSGEIEWDKDVVIKLYDKISSMVSDTFPQYMLSDFNVPLSRGEVIKASRECIASTALFVKRKRYALIVYDNEGKRLDVNGSKGKLKVTGLDLKRSDTPKFVSKFLSSILDDVLSNMEKDDVITKIREFKKEFSHKKSWEKGTPKAVKNISKYMDLILSHDMERKKTGKAKTLTVPGHVRASIYWNELRVANGDLHSMKILDGTKIVVCKLKETSTNTQSAIAYPIDEKHLPDWFMSLPFDDEQMLEDVVSKKTQNLLGVLKWDLTHTEIRAEHLRSLFDFTGMK